MVTSTSSTAGILILAAGKGTRMRSQLPKVLHVVAGEPLLFHILDRIAEVHPRASVGIVVGYQAALVQAAVQAEKRFASLSIEWIVQSEQKGTGHAAQVAMASAWGQKQINKKSPVLVLPGDLPLISDELVRQMAAPLKHGSVLRLLTCEVANPTGLGRIVRAGKRIKGIVEDRDCTPAQKKIKEVAQSIYLFDSEFLSAELPKLKSKNAQGEFYLTDLVSVAGRKEGLLENLIWWAVEDLLGANDPLELAGIRRALNNRLIRHWALSGVHFWDPETVWVDTGVEFEGECHVQPGVLLLGQTRIGRGVTIGAGCVLKNTLVGEKCEIKVGVVTDQAVLGPNVKIGPYANLRPGSKVSDDVKIGNFVELKQAEVGAHSSIAHLSYVGDAEIGERVNIGCGFVTCNYDGREINGNRKHKTVIEDDVFLGSDCQTVAPVRVGRGSFVASGSTITENVEAGSLAIARSRQVNKPGYAQKYARKSKERGSL